MMTVVSYYHFVRSYFNKSLGLVGFLGYFMLVPISILLSRGFLLASSQVTAGGALDFSFDAMFYGYGGIGALLLVLSIVLLAKGFRRSRDPSERNRLMYLLGAISFWMLFQFTNIIPGVANYSIDHLGNLGNALIISYAILRYELFNIKFAVRKFIAYTIELTLSIVIYVGAILLSLRLFPEQPLYSILTLSSSLALLLGITAPRFRLILEDWIERLLYRGTYEYRQTLLTFNARMSNILNLKQLANEMLPSLTKAMRISGARLMFQDNESGDFITQFHYPEVKNYHGEEFKLSADNPIITWLDRNSTPLDLAQVDSIAQFKGLWGSEKQLLTSSDIRLLYPLKSQRGLVGILALGKKSNNVLYSHEDIELITNMANRASMIIENAKLYTQALIQANTDGLTNLYNHRHFHERLDQEIGRGSRFGSTFSLVIIDLDLFKAYNDNYGHLAGDRALQRVAKCIVDSIRSIDLAFRYGGEEFAVILPETRIEDALKVAERIRKTIESRTSAKALPITASCGIACWPNDGVMKEEIVARADAALYLAKQSGRNRTCLSSEIIGPKSVSIGDELEAKPRALSIIYALAATIDAKDHYTYGHSRKVSNYAVALAEKLGLPVEQVSTVRAAGLLHDIGKVGIPDLILNKEGPLDEEEWHLIRSHPNFGVEILRHVIDLVNCLPAILHHHERFDGKGYPSGLKGDNIPIEALILSIADTYDAITSPRPYRNQLSPRQALEELKKCAGTQFNPELVDVFCKLLAPELPKKLEIK